MATTAKTVKPTPMGKVKTAAPSRDGVAIKGKTKAQHEIEPPKPRLLKRFWS